MLKRRKLTEKQLESARKYFGKESIALECECGRIVEKLPADTASVVCSYCLQAKVDRPEGIIPKKKTADDNRPRGWHLLKKYVSPSGKVYERGKEVVNPKKK